MSAPLEVGAKEGKHLCIPLGLFFTALCSTGAPPV
jgi:hypothetical protein